MRKKLFVLLIMLMFTIPLVLGATIDIDASTEFQTIDGFGGSESWRLPKTDSMFSTLFDDLGVSILRFQMFAYTESQPDVLGDKARDNDNDDPFTINWSGVSTGFIDAFAPLLQAAQSRGVKIIGTTWSPPAWMKQSPYVENSSDFVPGNEDELVEWILIWVKGMKQLHGIHIDSVTIQNEPDNLPPWPGCKYTSAQITDIVKRLGARFVAEGITTEIHAPDTTKLGSTYTNYVGSICNDPVAKAYVDVLATHPYGAEFYPVDNVIPQWVSASNLANSCGKKLWQTEFMGPSNEASWINAFTHIQHLHHALVYGQVSAFLTYELYDNRDGSGGTIDLGGPHPKFYTLKQYYRYVRPGAVRVNVSSDDSDVLVTSFKHNSDNTFTIVAINRKTSSEGVTFNINNAQVSILDVYRTSVTENSASLGQVLLVSGNSFLYNLPAESVTTFTGTIGGSPPTCSDLGGSCCQTGETCSGSSQSTIDCTNCCTLGTCQAPPPTTIHYVRPAGGSYGAEDGTNYDNAWDGLLNVVWGPGGVEAGHTLYVCGTHLLDVPARRSDQGRINVASGTDEANRVVIRGDCPGDQGIVWGSLNPVYESWVSEGSNTWSIYLPGGISSDPLIFEDISGCDGTILTKKGTLQEVMNTPGTFYSTDYKGNSKIYLHRTDSAAPNNNVYLDVWGYRWVWASGTKYVTLKNIQLCNAGLTFINDISYINIEDSLLKYRQNQYAVLSLGGADNHFEIINTTIEYGRQGISINYGSAGSHTVKDSIIRYQGYLPYHQGKVDPHCIGLQGGTSNNLFEGNEMYECNDGIVFYAYNGQDAKNNIVRGNYIHDLHGLGGHQVGMGIVFGAPGYVTLGDTSGNKVHSNIACDGERGLYYKWQDPLEVYNNVFCNNIVNIRVAGTYNDGTGASIELKNTVSLNPGTYHFEYMSNANPGNYVLDSDNNLFYPNSGNFFHFRDGPDEFYYTFSEWQTLSKPGCAFDSNSIVADPLFVDAANHDFHLQSGSPAIDAGVDVGLTRDYEGNFVPQNAGPDIGAYESSFSACNVAGDINGDCSVDLTDLIMVANDFGKISGFLSRADTNSDGEIDIFDIVYVASKI